MPCIDLNPSAAGPARMDLAYAGHDRHRRRGLLLWRLSNVLLPMFGGVLLAVGPRSLGDIASRHMPLPKAGPSVPLLSDERFAQLRAELR